MGIYGIAGKIKLADLRNLETGEWIYDQAEKTKAIFDVLYKHKEEIDSKISMPLIWDRKDDNIAASIVSRMKGDFTNPEEWDNIGHFHAKMTKELTDYAFLPYKKEIEALFNKTGNA